MQSILAKQSASGVDADTLIAAYDRHEHALEQTPPHRSFREVAGRGLQLAMDELSLSYEDADIEILTSGISRMPPFPEVPDALGELKEMGFKLCVISNTDDDIIAGNVAQLGGHIDRVVTAEQARAYKPSSQIFEHAHRELGVAIGDVVHICASPHLDLAAASNMGFRCIWINRGTGREPLPNYRPDEEFATLDSVPVRFRASGWAHES